MDFTLLLGLHKSKVGLLLKGRDSYFNMPDLVVLPKTLQPWPVAKRFRTFTTICGESNQRTYKTSLPPIHPLEHRYTFVCASLSAINAMFCKSSDK